MASVCKCNVQWNFTLTKSLFNEIFCWIFTLSYINMTINLHITKIYCIERSFPIFLCVQRSNEEIVVAMGIAVNLFQLIVWKYIIYIFNNSHLTEEMLKDFDMKSFRVSRKCFRWIVRIFTIVQKVLWKVFFYMKPVQGNIIQKLPFNEVSSLPLNI